MANEADRSGAAIGRRSASTNENRTRFGPHVIGLVMRFGMTDSDVVEGQPWRLLPGAGLVGHAADPLAPVVGPDVAPGVGDAPTLHAAATSPRPNARSARRLTRRSVGDDMREA